MLAKGSVPCHLQMRLSLLCVHDMQTRWQACSMFAVTSYALSVWVTNVKAQAFCSAVIEK